MTNRKLEVVFTIQFKRDIKLLSKRNYELGLLDKIIALLSAKTPLPAKNRDHILIGDKNEFRECHIRPDWLLIYKIEDNKLYLARTGTHSDLF